MNDATPTYRWNTSAAAEAYDVAAPAIHPHYEAVQNAILGQLRFSAAESFVAVDLGAGSGRLVERLLGNFTNARAVLVDQSEPFLALAERRLARYAPRVMFVQSRLQDDWATSGRVSPRLDLRVRRGGRDHVDVIVSTSAIHHLEPHEKQALFARCFAALKPGGVFVNGDEYRPADDGEFRALLEEWSTHMKGALDAGRIPESFRSTFDHWYDRNIRRFGEAKKSGDDCQETIETQIGYVREVGFANVEAVWSQELWAVLVAHKQSCES